MTIGIISLRAMDQIELKQNMGEENISKPISIKESLLTLENFHKLLIEVYKTFELADEMKSNETLYKKLKDQKFKSITQIEEKTLKYIKYLCKNNAVIEISEVKSLPEFEELLKVVEIRWSTIKVITERNKRRSYCIGLLRGVNKFTDKEQKAIVCRLIDFFDNTLNKKLELGSLVEIKKLEENCKKILFKIEEIFKNNEYNCEFLSGEMYNQVNECLFNQQEKILNYLINLYSNILNKICKSESISDFKISQQELKNIWNEMQSTFILFENDNNDNFKIYQDSNRGLNVYDSKKLQIFQDSKTLYDKFKNKANKCQDEGQKVMCDYLVKYYKSIENDAENILKNLSLE